MLTLLLFPEKSSQMGRRFVSHGAALEVCPGVMVNAQWFPGAISQIVGVIEVSARGRNDAV